MTHTYATLAISQDAYDEIRGALKAAGYDHAFMDDGEIDMHGIALEVDKPKLVMEPIIESKLVTMFGSYVNKWPRKALILLAEWTLLDRYVLEPETTKERRAVIAKELKRIADGELALSAMSSAGMKYAVPNFRFGTDLNKHPQLAVEWAKYDFSEREGTASAEVKKDLVERTKKARS